MIGPLLSFCVNCILLCRVTEPTVRAGRRILGPARSRYSNIKLQKIPSPSAFGPLWQSHTGIVAVAFGDQLAPRDHGETIRAQTQGLGLVARI